MAKMHTYYYSDVHVGFLSAEVEAETVEDAVAQSISTFEDIDDGSDWFGPHMTHHRADCPVVLEDDPYADCLGDGVCDERTPIIKAQVPECEATEDEHIWLTRSYRDLAHKILGGLKENPGVWGHGGGVYIRDVCGACGMGRLVDTWAQNPADGTQGYTITKYTRGQYLFDDRLCKIIQLAVALDDLKEYGILYLNRYPTVYHFALALASA